MPSRSQDPLNGIFFLKRKHLRCWKSYANSTWLPSPLTFQKADSTGLTEGLADGQPLPKAHFLGGMGDHTPCFEFGSEKPEEQQFEACRKS